MNYTVYESSYGSTPLSIARDWLKGYTGEYIFFRASQDEYYLIRGDIDFSTLSCDDCRVDLIFSAYNANHGSYWQLESFDSQSVSISNPSDCLLYASDSAYPHLIEGVDVYAFTLICVVSVAFMFRLFERVFRRLY